MKLKAGDPFPDISVTLDGGETVSLTQTQQAGCDWKLIVVYRGQHCPMCTRYLNTLEQVKHTLQETGVDIIAVSADSQAQLTQHKQALNVSFELAYGLTLEQMEQMGLYISNPRSAQETDHRFAEPGLFVVNEKNELHVVDISNNPFVRPDIATLISGLQWIRNPENHYPIRGTYQRS
jgi:peroxiredoxin